MSIVKINAIIPPYPKASAWRNAVEEIPFAAFVLDLVDPFSNRANRNAAAFVIVGDSTDLKEYLGNQPDSHELIESDMLAQLRDDSDISKALETHDRVGLVMNADLRKTASDPDLARPLRKVHLQPLLDGFSGMLDPESPPLTAETSN